MIKEKMYRYTGVNGSLTTPILLEGIKSIQIYKLTADQDKMLQNSITDDIRRFVYVLPEEINEWVEINNQSN